MRKEAKEMKRNFKVQTKIMSIFMLAMTLIISGGVIASINADREIGANLKTVLVSETSEVETKKENFQNAVCNQTCDVVKLTNEAKIEEKVEFKTPPFSHFVDFDGIANIAIGIVGVAMALCAIGLIAIYE